jgi:hypothetical protein
MGELIRMKKTEAPAKAKTKSKPKAKAEQPKYYFREIVVKGRPSIPKYLQLVKEYGPELGDYLSALIHHHNFCRYGGYAKVIWPMRDQMKKLQWSHSRIMKAKRELQKLHLVIYQKVKLSDGGRIEYIYLNIKRLRKVLVKDD